ncbi:hypothetical protein PtA15_8A235 [Puccinia triticina]|uniref:Uncharacterized protein n=1 Tax=Puccinia triticina TaxID=208348 RepID=A0ABY7CQ08_9BASI|nr:uncharacterized protein PtA15_8A235 [Puccinia triticina]WAQ87331.1 hypothetical protein PtA15_8A235 [Puccinia triticina]
MSFDASTATGSLPQTMNPLSNAANQGRPPQRQRNEGTPASPRVAFNPFLLLNPTNPKGACKDPNGLPGDPLILTPTQQLYADFGVQPVAEDLLLRYELTSPLPKSLCPSTTRINPEPAVGKWPGGPASIPSSSPTRIPSPAATGAATFTRLPIKRYRPHDPPPLEETDLTCRPAKKAAKPVKATHIVSKQQRQNVIQGGFGSLNNAKKPKTNGRGRRGEIKTGANKSVILKQAAEFAVWMAIGNSALSSKISRLENILLSHCIQVQLLSPPQKGPLDRW